VLNEQKRFYKLSDPLTCWSFLTGALVIGGLNPFRCF